MENKLVLKKLDPWSWFTRTVPQSEKETNPQNPVNHLHKEIDKVFNDFFNLLGIDPEKMVLSYSEMSVFPKVDISETEHSYIISAELPEVDEKDVIAEISECILTISGMKEQDTSIAEKHFHRIERNYGPFNRKFPLPADVDVSSIKATFSKGILHINIEKLSDTEKNVTKIEIESESSSDE